MKNEEPKQYILVDNKTNIITSVMDFEIDKQKDVTQIEIPSDAKPEDYAGRLWKNGKAVDTLDALKQNKLSEFKTDKFLEIDGNTYSSKRTDIIKYKEAVDTHKLKEDTKVYLNTAKGKTELTVAQADNVIKELSSKALDDYWIEDDFKQKVNNAKTEKALQNIKG